MSKIGLGDQNYMIGYKRKTKCVNNFKNGPKSKLEIIRGIKFAILLNIIKGNSLT